MAGGGPHRSGGNPLSHGFAVPALPEGEPRELRTVLAPRIYEGGGPRSGRGSPPPQRRGKPPQSRLRRASSPGGEAEGAARQLSQRESQGSCAPFFPPAFMRGEGHEVAGGVPRIYEGGGPRSGRGSPPPPQREPSQSRLRRASSPGGEAKGAALRSPGIPGKSKPVFLPRRFKIRNFTGT